MVRLIIVILLQGILCGASVLPLHGNDQPDASMCYSQPHHQCQEVREWWG